MVNIRGIMTGYESRSESKVVYEVKVGYIRSLEA